MTELSEPERAEEDQREAAQSSAPRYSRRLSDKVLIAFHQACDLADYEVADALLLSMDRMLERRLSSDRSDRRQIASLVAAHERLWHLRHPDEEAKF